MALLGWALNGKLQRICYAGQNVKNAPPRKEGCSMKHAFLGFFATFWLMLAALAQSPPVPKLPDTPKRPVTDEYQGIKVTDDYRWLENWDDPESKQWSTAENTYSRNYLDSLPARTAIKERLRQLISESS